MEYFTNQEGNYKYNLGVFVYLKPDSFSQEWFQNGKSVGKETMSI